MLVIKVELHSAITGKISLLNTILIDNIGGTKSRGNYRVRSFRKGVDVVATRARTGLLREGQVLDHPRLSQPVGNLLVKALKQLGYD